MTTIEIKRDACARDGVCAAECPMGLFTDDEQGLAVLVDGAEDHCIECGHCLTICPTGAIVLNGVSQSDCDPVNPSMWPDGEGVLQYLKSRRSIRSYKRKEVDQELLEKLVDVTRWAPTARNGQPVEWTLAQGRSKVQELGRYVSAWLRESGVYPHLADAFDAGKDYLLRNAPALAMVHARTDSLKPAEDCLTALTTMEIACRAVGLGACWAGYFHAAAVNYEPLREKLNLPDGHEIFGGLMLGYPRFTYNYIPPRKEAVVHWL